MKFRIESTSSKPENSNMEFILPGFFKSTESDFNNLILSSEYPESVPAHDDEISSLISHALLSPIQHTVHIG